MKITACYFDDLPKWVDKSSLSNNGSGKEFATYLVIEDGDYRAVYSDAMEPEDARFGRALKWITTELYRVDKLRQETGKVRDEWCAEYTKARDTLRAICDMTDPFADGAPDASHHAKLCNEIASLSREY